MWHKIIIKQFSTEIMFYNIPLKFSTFPGRRFIMPKFTCTCVMTEKVHKNRLSLHVVYEHGHFFSQSYFSGFDRLLHVMTTVFHFHLPKLKWNNTNIINYFGNCLAFVLSCAYCSLLFVPLSSLTGNGFKSFVGWLKSSKNRMSPH